MPKRKLLIDAGTKKIYSEESSEDLIVAFNDNLPDMDGKSNGKVKGKGSQNGLVSAQIFAYLESHNILTHFIGRPADKEIQVKNIEMLPVEVVIYNAADKILSKKYGFEEGAALAVPVIEYIYINEQLKNPVVNETHLGALNILAPEEVIFFCRIIAKTNAVLKSFFERRQLFLVRMQLSIGRQKGNLYIGDEISPDTCQFWGIGEENIFDKKRFHQEKGNSAAVYKLIADRIMGGV